MKKGDSSLLLLICSLFVFGWIVQQIANFIAKFGGFGIALIILAVVAVMFGMYKLWKKNNLTHEEMIRHFLHNQVHWKQAQRINHTIGKKSYPLETILRSVQIIHDSVYIALNSKKEDTARSRIHSARESLFRIDEYRSYISPELYIEIEAYVKTAEEEFKTLLFANVAKGHVEKGYTLKTPKSRQKYFTLAREMLNRGIRESGGYNPTLQEILGIIPDE